MKKRRRRFSVRFLYSMAKTMSGIDGGGGTLWWTARVSKLYGSAPEELCPSNSSDSEEDFSEKSISVQAFMEAQKRRTSYYRRLYSIEDCMLGLQHTPLSMSFDLFESIANCSDGNIKLPRIGEDQIGSHAVTIYGYSQKEKHFKFQNSWGAGWGNKGLGTLPFEYFNQGLVSEVWMSGIHAGNPAYNEESFYIKSKKNKKANVVVLYYRTSTHKGFPIICFDVYLGDSNLIIGCAHIGVINEKELELEEFFLLPQYHRQGFGKNLLKLIEDWAKYHKFEKIIGWVGAQDLVAGREEGVKSFFKNSKFTIVEDNSKFRDSVYRVSKVIK